MIEKHAFIDKMTNLWPNVVALASHCEWLE